MKHSTLHAITILLQRGVRLEVARDGEGEGSRGEKEKGETPGGVSSIRRFEIIAIATSGRNYRKAEGVTATRNYYEPCVFEAKRMFIL